MAWSVARATNCILVLKSIAQDIDESRTEDIALNFVAVDGPVIVTLLLEHFACAVPLMHLL